MKRTYMVVFTVILSLLLSGCLYPDSELKNNETSNEVQLKTVQNAVETYKDEKNGLVPIKTKENDTPIFQKYLVDFSLLKEANILSEIPGNAYEKGGTYQYAILDPEDNPQVKLIDLRLSEAIRKVNIELDLYRNEHTYPPFGEKITKDLFKIDYEKLGLDSSPHVKSPYSNHQLPIIMDSEGKLYIDYRIELNEALQEYDHSYDTGDDIRFILAENTPFLPVYSYPTTISENEPVFQES